MATSRAVRSSLLLVAVIAGAILACNLPNVSSDEGSVETQVAETLTALPSGTPAGPSATPAPTEGAQPTETQQPTAPPPTATAVPPTATPPTGGISLNCDGTYQRVRISDQGASGKTISVDNWDGNGWVNVWNVSSGDPNLKQLTSDAGYYGFGDCESLVIVPFQHSNPQLWFELGIYSWGGADMEPKYAREGYYGEWEKVGDLIRFRYASQLGFVNGSPLGPCEWITFEHTWNGTAFTQTGSLVQPVASCTPIPSPTP